jgi:type IV secretory pathway TraG/TraD family ATPase VirD4
MTLYLCLPAIYMSSYNRWLRLIVAMTLTVMERTKPEQFKPPVLFLLVSGTQIHGVD